MVAVALASCGGSSAPLTASNSPGNPAGFPVGPPLVTPGERMTYRVQLRGVELAAMSLGVSETTDQVAGKRAIVVQGRARSVGLAQLVSKIDDSFTSWIDVETGRSLRFAVDEYQTNSDVNVEHTIADLASRAGNRLPITFAVNNAAPAPEPQTLSMAEVWDYNAFLVALRSWEAPIGTTIALEVLRSRYLWHIDLKIAAKTKLVTELDEFPALRFDGYTYKLKRDGSRDTESDPRRFSIWISDDAGRVPLLLTARTDYGDVRMEIVEYFPGTSAPLRTAR